MKPIAFEEHNVVFAKDQKEYQPLPALKFEDGTVVTCWKLSWKELFRLAFTRKIWLAQLSFNKPLQPQFVTVNKNDIIKEEK